MAISSSLAAPDQSVEQGASPSVQSDKQYYLTSAGRLVEQPEPGAQLVEQTDQGLVLGDNQTPIQLFLNPQSGVVSIDTDGESINDLSQAALRSKNIILQQQHDKLLTQSKQQKNTQKLQVDSLIQNFLSDEQSSQLQSLESINTYSDQLLEIRRLRTQLKTQLDTMIAGDDFDIRGAQALIKSSAQQIQQQIATAWKQLTQGEITPATAKDFVRSVRIPILPLGLASVQGKVTVANPKARLQARRNRRIVQMVNQIQQSDNPPLNGINAVMAFSPKSNNRLSPGIRSGIISDLKSMKIGVKQKLWSADRSDTSMDEKYTQQAKLILQQLQRNGMSPQDKTYQQIKKRLVRYRRQYLQNRKNTLGQAQRSSL